MPSLFMYRVLLWPLFILINVFQSYSWCVPSLMRAAVRVVGQADVSSSEYEHANIFS